MSKAAQREEIERLTADYTGAGGSITRSRAEQKVRVMCSSCRSWRMVSTLRYRIACDRCGEEVRPWWLGYMPGGR
jgi:hypothetical protein